MNTFCLISSRSAVPCFQEVIRYNCDHRNEVSGLRCRLSSVSWFGSCYTGMLREDSSGLWYVHLYECYMSVKINKTLLPIYLEHLQEVVTTHLKDNGPFHIPLNTYSQVLCFKKISPQIGIWSVLWVVSIHRLLVRSVGKYGSWDFVGLHCCYILKSQGVTRETSPNAVNREASTSIVLACSGCFWSC